TLTVERLKGTLFSGIELDNVKLSMNGRDVVAIDAVKASYRLADLFSKGVSITNVEISRPTVEVRRVENGWEFGGLFKPRENPNDTRVLRKAVSLEPVPVAGATVRLTGLHPGRPGAAPAVRVPASLEHLDAALSFHYEPDRYSVDIARLSMAATGPE